MIPFSPTVSVTPARRVAIGLCALAVLLGGCKKNKDGPTAPTVVPGRTTMVATSTSGYIEARTSQIVTNGQPPAVVFDDFTLTTGFTIRTIGWQGVYCVQQNNAPAPAATATAFTVKIYTDVGGRPNVASPVASETFTVPQSGQTFDKNVSGLICGSASNVTYAFYRYSATLSTPFAAVAGTKYWLSVQATTPSYDVYYGWRDGLVDNGTSLQLFNGAYTVYPVDRAYSLAP